MWVTVIPIVIGALGTVPKGLEMRLEELEIRKETRRIRNQKKSEDHPDSSIVKISQNTQKSTGDLRRLAIN